MHNDQTPVYGGSGGVHYDLYPDNASQDVKLLEAWSGWGSGDCNDKWVLKGLKLTWADGSNKKLYNHPQDTDMYQTFPFPKGNTADWSLRSGHRVDELRFKTDRGVPWITGGDGGSDHDHIAKGALVGFEGKAGWEIDSLSMRYRD